MRIPSFSSFLAAVTPAAVQGILITKFGLKEVLNNKISSFSHGMKQKLFLIASLITDPQNWILDEPMVGLDPEAAFIVKEINDS